MKGRLLRFKSRAARIPHNPYPYLPDVACKWRVTAKCRLGIHTHGSLRSLKGWKYKYNAPEERRPKQELQNATPNDG